MRKRSQTKNTNSDSKKKTRVITPLSDLELKNITGGLEDDVYDSVDQIDLWL